LSNPIPGALSVAADLFSEIFSLEALRDESLKAVEKLVFVLVAKEEKTKAELEYCQIMAEYIFAPFADYAIKLKKQKRKKLRKSEAWISSEEEDKTKLDSLFDF